MSPGLRGAFYYSLFWTADAAFEPFINVHFSRLGLSGIEIGWLSMFFPLFILINPPWVNRLADKYGIRVRLLTVCLFIVAISIIFYAFPRTFIQFLPVVILVAIIRSATGPLADSLIARMAGKYQVDYGRMRLWGSLTFAFTSLVLGYVWSLVGFSYIFIVAGILFFPTAIAAALLEETPTDTAPQVALAPSLNAFKLFIQDKSLVLVSIAAFLGTGAMVMASNFIGIYMQTVGGNETYIGALWGFSALFEVPVMLFSSKIARRLGDTTTLILAYLLFAVGFLGYSFSHSPILLVIFASVRGLGFGLMFVNTVTIIDRRAPSCFSSTYQGIEAALAWGLAPLLASLLSGWIFDKMGAAPLFIICAVTALLGGLLMIPTYFMWSKPVPNQSA
jgi:MFS transporter, PPP family, 3-phenylpropionic acid transporter